MKKLIAIILCFSTLAYANEAPSFTESIGLFIDSAPKSTDIYERMCGEKVSENVFQDKKAWKPVCEIITKSEACKDAEKHLLIDCNSTDDISISYWDMFTTKECLAGLGKSLSEFWDFLVVASKWLGGAVIDSDKRAKALSQTNSLRLAAANYLAVEYEKIVEDNKSFGMSEDEAERKALAILAPHLFSKMMTALSKFIEKSYYQLGCYERDERTVRMCAIMSDIFFPPVAAIGLLARSGVKGSAKIAQIASDKFTGRGKVHFPGEADKYAGPNFKKEFKAKEKQVKKDIDANIKLFADDSGLSRSARKTAQTNIKDWLYEVKRLDDLVSAGDKKYYSLINHLAKNDVNKVDMLEVAAKYKKGHDPMKLVDELMNKKADSLKYPQASTLDPYLQAPKSGFFAKLMPGDHSKLIESRKTFLSRLASEDPDLYDDFVKNMLSKQTDADKVKVLDDTMKAFAKTNDPIEAVAKGSKLKTADNFYPIKLTVESSKVPKSLSRNKLRDQIYKRIPASMREHYKVKVDKSILGGDKVHFQIQADLSKLDNFDPMLIDINKQLSKQLRGTDDFKELYKVWRGPDDQMLLDRLLFVAKKKWPNRSNKDIALRVQDEINVCKVK